MKHPLRAVIAPVVLLLAGAAAAAEPAAETAEPKPSGRASEPAVQRIVTEDDNVRIDELRVRGETQSITVHSKTPGVKPYEIVPSSGKRDPSQQGGTAGQRVWNVLKF